MRKEPKVVSPSSLLTAAPVLFLQTEEPHIHLVYAFNIFRKNGLVRVFMNRVVIVAALQIGHNLVKLVNFGVHHAQVRDKPHLVDIEPAVCDLLMGLTGLFSFYHFSFYPSARGAQQLVIVHMKSDTVCP
jgi:hypothetical protein